MHHLSSLTSPVLRESLVSLTLLLAPFTPHLAEELWEMLGETGSVHQQRWPEHDPAALVVDEIEIVVQVNGRVRDHLNVPAGIGQVEMERSVLAQHVCRNCSRARNWCGRSVSPANW